ncbi:MAG: ATP-dependent DNA helicase RecG [Alphaproteobacteria bacterium]|nr:ATP-dependent DNA helicase RecG [Alphaproteobacteria bacterium]
MHNTQLKAAAQERPFILDPLYRSVTTLPGVGPRNAKLFERLCEGERIWDLLCHLPSDVVERIEVDQLREADSGKVVIVKAKVHKYSISRKRSVPSRIHCTAGDSALDLVFFHAREDYLKRSFPMGEEKEISGTLVYYRGRAQITHPDFFAKGDGAEAFDTVEPVYPMTQGLGHKVLRKAVQASLRLIPELPEWQDQTVLKSRGWQGWKEALATCHNPKARSMLAPDSKARLRLAYDEMLAHQLALTLIRKAQQKAKGRAIQPKDSVLRDKFLASIPFELTGAQKRVIGEIDADMASNMAMVRLVQGDVGSGKTMVACAAMLNAVACGMQAALMAPTEILARQHAESLGPLLDEMGVRYVVLTGRDKGKAKELLLQQVKNGAAQVVIGTHALFQDKVEFQDLGLAVIDEQHRFGVHQRLKLSQKGVSDVLVMTATPIPRTLALTAYGDMDVSRIDEKPAGRKPVDTRLVPKDKLEDMVAGLIRQIREEKAQIYWVCPLVEESEVMDLAAAEERFDVLQSVLGDRVGLVHGRMKAEDKDAVMKKFAAGDLDVLVATTVIEVGVNVPNASIMVIEHAERFGLAQLHQLRGRVGRGERQSHCFLLYGKPISETGKARLKIMRDTEDGFIIAEEDMRLRGAGDILGTRQSGLPDYMLADLSVHGDIIAMARSEAQLIVQKDPRLSSERGAALKNLLYLFNLKEALDYLRSG